jgi:hypothetical protein
MMRSLRSRLMWCSLAVAFSFWGMPARAARVEIRPERELLITEPAVLDSGPGQYPGAWSFGTLVEQLAGAENASAHVRDWLETWTVGLTVNGQRVAPRPEIVEKVIKPWKERDGYDPGSGKPWKPNLANAPFRLLAIVNRMDLCAPRVAGTLKEIEETWRLQGRESDFLTLHSQAFGEAPLPSSSNGGYGGGDGLENGEEESVPEVQFAGEGRLVFGATDSDGLPLPGDWTVIFEYNLLATKERPVSQWARLWHDLGNPDFTETEFAARLERVTRMFTHRHSASKPGVSLAQLRTSEAAFGPDREFRQFNGKFMPMPLALTPAPSFARKDSIEQHFLFAFLQQQDRLIRSGIHQLPPTLPVNRKPTPVLAGSAFIPADNPNFFWERGPLVSPDARRIFSLNTCNGCHAGETGCPDGLHIHPRSEGSAARVSDFLRADGQTHRVSNPDVPDSALEYRELQDRADILAALLKPRDRAGMDGLRSVLHGRLERIH